MKEFFIKIKSLFERRGAEEAKRSLDETGRAVDDVQTKARPGPMRRFFDQTRQGATHAARAVGNLARVFSGFLGLAGGVGFAAMGRSLLNLAENIERAAQTAGMSTRQWQELEFAARQNKATGDDLLQTVARLNEEIGRGGDQLTKYGIAVTDASGRNREAVEVLRDVADAMANAETQDRRAAIARDILGRSSRRLIPLLQQGSAALDEYARAARESGQVMEEDLIRRLNDAQDSLQRLGRRITIHAGEAVQELNAMWAAFSARPQDEAGRGLLEARRQAVRQLVEEGELTQQQALRLVSQNRLVQRLTVSAEARAAAEERTQQILNEQTREKLEQGGIDAEANARAEYQAQKEREKLELRERQAAIAEMFADAEQRRQFETAGAAEKLLIIEEEMARLREKVDKSGDIEAGERLVELTQIRLDLLKEIGESEKRTGEQTRSTLETLLDEYRILQARAAGNDALADQLDHEKRVREETARIVRETGMEEERAEAFVRRRLELEERIAERKRKEREGGAEGSGGASRQDELMRAAAADPEGRTAEGRNARMRLVEEGRLSRDAGAASEQLAGFSRSEGALREQASASRGMAEAMREADRQLAALIAENIATMRQIKEQQERLAQEVRSNR